jgi:hypothetical protein
MSHELMYGFGCGSFPLSARAKAQGSPVELSVAEYGLA